MPLLVAHQILIGAAVALAALFGVRAFVLFARGGGVGELIIALASAAVSFALTLYFRKVRATWRASRGQLPRSRPR